MQSAVLWGCVSKPDHELSLPITYLPRTYPRQSLRELGHGLVERDILQEFDPREENVDGHRAVRCPRPNNR